MKQKKKTTAQQLDNPLVFTRYSTVTTHSQQQGWLKCFTVSTSEVKHTSVFLALMTMTFMLPCIAPLFISTTFPLSSPTSSRCPCVCLPPNSQCLKQPGLLREVNCTQIMFDRKRSEGVIEKGPRDRGEGGREWMLEWEDNCARERRCD